MKIIFLGTNGWYSSKAGLTVCTLIDAKEGYIVLDAGEGIQKLDKYITDLTKPIYLFLSHFHLDHIYGFHILDKFIFKNKIQVIGKVGTKKILDLIVNQPFTSKLEDTPFKETHLYFESPDKRIIEVEEGEHEYPVKFSCALLPHSDLSMGYRFELEGKIITYCTDTGRSDKAIGLAKNSDIFISECAYLSGEPINPDWAHMNPEEAAKEAKDANVKKLVLTHFGAMRYDAVEKRKETERVAKEIFKNTVVAFDDMEVEL
jgi:ribonuclease BN (tRNA processing enzyme)